MSTEERIANARLVHRIGFGPKPGQFRKMMKQGFKVSAKQLLTSGQPDYGDVKTAIGIADLGREPKPNSPSLSSYAVAKRAQLRNMSLWWLDQMVDQDFPFVERMTWFWHGHCRIPNCQLVLIKDHLREERLLSRRSELIEIEHIPIRVSDHCHNPTPRLASRWHREAHFESSETCKLRIKVGNHKANPRVSPKQVGVILARKCDAESNGSGRKGCIAVIGGGEL